MVVCVSRAILQIHNPWRRLAAGLLLSSMVLGTVVSAHAREAKPLSQTTRLVSVGQLQNVARASRYPIYWVGAMPHRQLELTKASAGVFVRYLPTGVKAGDRRRFLGVVTYPLPNAYKLTRSFVRTRGARLYRLSHGWIAVRNPARPNSVYVSYPRSPVQIEVNDRDPARALRLVKAGSVKPIVP